ncbi:MAG: hypothetical protein LBV60_11090 [Streptomyces sp.]|jgi:hypothetical protein|nr:hypothetical protein [Streptomyces sp.]
MNPTPPLRYSAPAPSAPSDGAPRDRSRLTAFLSALLFVPAAVVVYILSLFQSNAAQCLEYGECHPGIPGAVAPWSLWIAAAALLVALAAPWLQVRRTALALQLAAECTALLVILAYP